MINATLLEALGNKKSLKETTSQFYIDLPDHLEVDHMNKFFQKESKRKKNKS